MKITRRVLAFLLLAGAPFALLLAKAPEKKATQQYMAYVGTYTTKTASKGIYALRFDPATGKVTAPQLAAESADPSFLAVHPNGKYLYAVNEAGKSSMVSAFAVEAGNGKLKLLNQLPALGEDPCYITFDRSGKYVFVANYSSGNVVVFPILADGKLGEHTALVKDEGTLGPNKERQERPHAHWIAASADNRFAYVSDLGLDRVLVYKFDAAKGAFSSIPPGQSGWSRNGHTTDPSIRLYPGTGPRHAAFSRHGQMYVLGELESTVTVFSAPGLDEDRTRSIQRISALPAGFSGRNDAAEIAMHPDGKFVYTSNRGNDSIAVFAVEPAKGTLQLVENVPTGGKEPRHFAIDPSGRYLLAENQLSDSIVEFRIDPATGKLTPTGETAHIPSPVCLQFLSLR